MNKTKVYYNGIAKGYASLYHEEQKNKINYVKDYFPLNGEVLDLGSGDGILNNFLNLNLISLYSFDISVELLKLNSNVEKRKFLGNICENLPFKNNQFDYIFSFSVFQDLTCLNIAFDEVKRVLKNEGLFIISFIKFSQKKEIILDLINENFLVLKKFEEEKDLIFVLKKI